MASRARVFDHLACAVTLGAGLLNREKALLHAHLAVTAAGGASHWLGAGFCAGALAGFALSHDRNADLGFAAARRVFQRDFHVIAQVSATVHVGTACAASRAKNITENITECIREITETLCAGTRPHARLYP